MPKDYAKSRIKRIYGGEGIEWQVRDRRGWFWAGAGNTADAINEACAEAYLDGRKAQARKDAGKVTRLVPCSCCKAAPKGSTPFCESFGCGTLRDIAREILASVSAKRGKRT